MHRRPGGRRPPGPPRELDLPPDERRRRHDARGPDRRPAIPVRRLRARGGRAPRRHCPRRDRGLPIPLRHHVGPSRSVPVPPDRDRDPRPRLAPRHLVVEFLDTPRPRGRLSHRRELLPSRRDLLDRARIPGIRTRPIDGIPERVRRCGRHPGDGQWGRAGGRDRLAVAVRPLGRLESARGRGRSVARPRSLLASSAALTIAGLVGALVNDLRVVLVAFWTLGSALFLTYPALFSFVAESSHRRLQGAAFGLIFAFQLLGGAVGLVFAGLLADSFGPTIAFETSVPFTLAAALAFLGFVLLVMVRGQVANPRGTAASSVPPL